MSAQAVVRPGLRATLREGLNGLREAGLLKSERIITGPQGAHITVQGRPPVINLCSNNYLGLATDSALSLAAKAAIDTHGFGLASVRFICGTQDLHKNLERKLAEAHGKNDATLYASCFDANAAIFESILTDRDVVISDALNHASIIDGIRLCKAQRMRFQHADMQDLESKLRAASDSDARNILVATDSVFSMDGNLAPLPDICDLAKKYGASVFVDECHGTGVLGANGRGAVEHFGVTDAVDVINSTFGKALGGAIGGFTVAHEEYCETLRQRARPYLFSNTLPPAIVASAIVAIDAVANRPELRQRLQHNTKRFRDGMQALGFEIKPGFHPIVPVMLGDAKLAAQFADDMLAEGVYVIGFSYPVVPKGAARIRVQLSAQLSDDDVDAALAAFGKIGQKYKVINARMSAL
jgi:glycine C-acetyltransferase